MKEEGGNGIGQQVSLFFGEEGAIVCIADRNNYAAQEVSNKIGEKGGRFRAFQVNVSNSKEVL